MSDALKPCPLCGYTARVVEVCGNDWVVECALWRDDAILLTDTYCTCSTTGSSSRESAIAAWNRRAEADQLRARIAELERERDEERERVYRESCMYCRDRPDVGAAFRWVNGAASWKHPGYLNCGASHIRERHYQQQEGKGDGE